MQHNSQNTHSISGYIVALYALIKGKHFLSLTGFHKRRNCSKSDMQKFLLFCHRLRLRHKRLVHLIPSFLFFRTLNHGCTFNANNLHTTNSTTCE